MFGQESNCLYLIVWLYAIKRHSGRSVNMNKMKLFISSGEEIYLSEPQTNLQSRLDWFLFFFLHRERVFMVVILLNNIKRLLIKGEIWITTNVRYLYERLEVLRRSNLWVHLGVKTCEVFLCFVAIVRVRVYYVDIFVFFVLRHW